MRAILLTAGLAACFPLPNPNYPPELPLDPSLTTCQKDDDCVIVELGCCDACNGGFAVAVSADARGDVIEEYSESCPVNVACTLRACPPLVPRCDVDTCVAEQSSTF